MTLPATVEGREPVRLFCALRLPDAALDVLSEWQAVHIRAGRPVRREQLHVTLAFLGRRPMEELDSIVGALHESAATARPIRLRPERYRETRSVGMLTLTDQAGAAGALADELQRRLERLGVYERERRQWLPHLTVVRFRERPRLRPPLPDLGEVVPSDAAAFISRLRPSGAEYLVVDSIALGG